MGNCAASSSGIFLRVALYPSYILWRNVGAGKSNATAIYFGLYLPIMPMSMVVKP